MSNEHRGAGQRTDRVDGIEGKVGSRSLHHPTQASSPTSFTGPIVLEQAGNSQHISPMPQPDSEDNFPITLTPEGDTPKLYPTTNADNL